MNKVCVVYHNREDLQPHKLLDVYSSSDNTVYL